MAFRLFYSAYGAATSNVIAPSITATNVDSYNVMTSAVGGFTNSVIGPSVGSSTN